VRPAAFITALVPFAATLLLGLITSGVTRAEAEVPALRERASMTAMDATVLFRPGELLMGSPLVQGRPAVRPLDPSFVTELPEDQGDYELLSDGCLGAPGERGPAVIEGGVFARGDMGGDGKLEQVRIRRKAPMAAPEVLVSRDDQPVGRGELPVPAVPCRGLIAEAEADGQPVLMIVWTSRGAESTTVGVTIFELDEAPAAAD
jgi:hypothetical protein